MILAASNLYGDLVATWCGAEFVWRLGVVLAASKLYGDFVGLRLGSDLVVPNLYDD